MNRTRACLLAIAPLLAVLAACGGGGSDESSSNLEQTLRVAGGGGIEGTGLVAGIGLSATATTRPSCGYDAVNVTVDRVRVNASATAEDVGAGWSEVVLSPPKRIDIVQLANGVLEPLGETALPAGRYTQMRLVLAPNSAANPLANAVTPTGGTAIALNTPSAQQSGLKLNVSLELPASQTSNFALDFDICKSVAGGGNGSQFQFKPVIAVIPIAPNTGSSGVPPKAD